jgi:hypothetical protein
LEAAAYSRGAIYACGERAFLRSGYGWGKGKRTKAVAMPSRDLFAAAFVIILQKVPKYFAAIADDARADRF